MTAQGPEVPPAAKGSPDDSALTQLLAEKAEQPAGQSEDCPDGAQDEQGIREHRDHCPGYQDYHNPDQCPDMLWVLTVTLARHDASDSRQVVVSEQTVPQLEDALTRYRHILDENPEMPVCDLLPLIFRLKGKPFSIRDHFPHEPMYRLNMIPRRQITKAGRQVAKSTNMASVGILRAATVPYYNLLTVTPLFEQVRRFSSNYVKPFLAETTLRSHIIGAGTDNSVLQRTLANGSNLYYNFASKSADRIRGTPADELNVDEVQDFDLDTLPVIESCLDASTYGILRYSGTPKTFDGPLQCYWDLSSQGVWHIPCQVTGCKHENVCSTDGDILKMIDNPKTLVCAKCAQPLDARLGQYVHRRPERRLSFPGYHMPQVIFPMHYALPNKWQKIQDALREKPKFIIWNEILGESLDVGQKLLTVDDLKRAGKAPFCTPGQYDSNRYIMSAGGVDWGGKGKERVTDKEEFISNTALALGGMRNDGVIEIRWLYRTPYEANNYEEAKLVYETFRDTGIDWLSHDFGGAGNVREDILIQLGMPREHIAPFTYATLMFNKPIVFFEPSGERGARSSYTLDKPRSLFLLAELIKAGIVILPEYERVKDFVEDFLSMYEETIETPRGKQSLVKRIPRKHDDIAHAINYVVMTLLHATGRWPKIAEAYQNLKGPDQNWNEHDL